MLREGRKVAIDKAPTPVSLRCSSAGMQWVEASYWQAGILNIETKRENVFVEIVRYYIASDLKFHEQSKWIGTSSNSPDLVTDM